MSLSPGTTLGPYSVTALIGRGGMGEVYRAHDTKLGRDVALKVLPDLFADDPERLARFQREARVLASLNHPNIASIYGLEESDPATGSGQAVRALVLELVEGPTLAERIAQGAIPVDEALPIAKQIADALEAAHGAGVIHRDLKPANVKVKPDGMVKVLDFGLAKALEPEASGDPSESPTLTAAATRMGVIMGTAAYMSPEQAAGKAVDKRGDIWSFGVVLYEMLTGQRLFTGETVSHVLAKVLDRELDFGALPTSTPAPIRRLLRRCLERQSKRRLGDVGEALSHLEEAAVSPPTETTAPVPAPTVASNRLSLVRMAAIAVVASLVTGGVMWSLRSSPPPGMPGRFVVSASPSAVPRPSSNQTELAISPDGSTIVYRTFADGESRVYVRRVDRLEGELLPGVEGARSFFFSPDGQWLGFSTGVDQTLKKIQVTGGAPITLCPMPSGPRGASWGPDNTIIFARFGLGLGLFRVSASGGEPEMLTTPDPPERHYWPELLPGGGAVLFTIAATGNVTGETSQIAVLDLDTQEQRVLIEGGTHPRYVSGHLVYTFNDTLRAVRFDADRREVLSDPIPVLEGLTSSISGGSNVDLSDGGALVYQTGGLQADARTLVWVDRQGNEEEVPAEPGSYNSVRLSADGRSVVAEVQDLDNVDVMIYDLERDTPTRFTFDPAIDQFPIVTPDGERVVFQSNRESVGNLYWKAADGTGEVHRLTTSDSIQAAMSFTPDGSRLVFAELTNNGVVDLGVLSMDGEGSVEWLLTGPSYEMYGELSPDGRWMAYVSFESGQPEVYVRPFPNVQGGRRQVSRDGGFWPLWGPDGSELFYQTRNADGSVTVMVAPIEAESTLVVGNSVPLFAGPYRRIAVNNPRSYDIAPDGQRFLMLKPIVDADEREETAVILVENWIEELKSLFPTDR